MKKVFIAVLLCLVFSFVAIAEQLPTEESLIAAWEEIQKSDPNNIKFEKIKDAVIARGEELNLKVVVQHEAIFNTMHRI